MITITAIHAKDHFNEMLHQAQNNLVELTDKGETVAYLLSPKELRKLLADQTRRDNAVLKYQHYQERVADLVHPDVNLLSDEDINRLVHELR